MLRQTEWETNRRTDTVPLHRPCFAYYASCVDNNTPILCWHLWLRRVKEAGHRVQSVRGHRTQPHRSRRAACVVDHSVGHWSDLQIRRQIIIIIIIIIIAMAMFMLLSSWPKSLREFTRFIWWMQTERRVAANPQTKPVDLGCESAENWQLSSTSTIVIVIITQPVSWYSFYRPRKG